MISHRASDALRTVRHAARLSVGMLLALVVLGVGLFLALGLLVSHFLCHVFISLSCGVLAALYVIIVEGAIRGT